MKKLLLNSLIAGAFLVPVAAADDAEAQDYCREYTKTIRVGGKIQSGYGTACLQPDGSWMIVAANGNVDPFDSLRRNNAVLVAYNRPVYFAYGPWLRPVTYNVPVPYYYFDLWDRGRHYGWRNNWCSDGWRGDGRDDDRGRDHRRQHTRH